ncbi:hypothetical protein [Microvirga sp. Mcv34]|uniref:hypothetical protein n=1 Tax=Microvirga sp. Mcv34 TaxID=2926016 RepID=UPI0021C77ED8|nr:hypothetical protein [Microvirga sp. Mcv34]
MRRSLASVIATDKEDDHLLGELQHTLAELADVELRHKVEREKIQAWPGSLADQERRFAECDRRCRLAREPFHHHLAKLQRQILLQASLGR